MKYSKTQLKALLALCKGEKVLVQLLGDDLFDDVQASGCTTLSSEGDRLMVSSKDEHLPVYLAHLDPEFENIEDSIRKIDERRAMARQCAKISDGTTVHTSLAIDNGLFVRLKRAAIVQGNRSLRSVLEEAISAWLKLNE